eukprot:4162210-Pyramimonas_sp.AAC.1
MSVTDRRILLEAVILRQSLKKVSISGSRASRCWRTGTIDTRTKATWTRERGSQQGGRHAEREHDKVRQAGAVRRHRWQQRGDFDMAGGRVQLRR